MKIYSKFNSYRQKKFQITTTVEMIKGKKVASKTATNQEAETFLQSLGTKYDYLVSHDYPLRPCSLKINKNQVQFEYIEGETLLSKLEKVYQSYDEESVRRWLVYYSQVLDKIPNKIEELTEDFKAIFGENDERWDCVQAGCLDLNFDNIVIDAKNQGHLIDYEWCFQFPLPKEYIAWRAISELIMLLAKLEINPEFVKKTLPPTFQDKEAFYEFEYHFQKYVQGEKMMQTYAQFKKERQMSSSLDFQSKWSEALKKASLEGQDYLKTALYDYEKALEEKNKIIKQQADNIANLSVGLTSFGAQVDDFSEQAKLFGEKVKNVDHFKAHLEKVSQEKITLLEKWIQERDVQVQELKDSKRLLEHRVDEQEKEMKKIQEEREKYIADTHLILQNKEEEVKKVLREQQEYIGVKMLQEQLQVEKEHFKQSYEKDHAELQVVQRDLDRIRQSLTWKSLNLIYRWLFLEWVHQRMARFIKARRITIPRAAKPMFTGSTKDAHGKPLVFGWKGDMEHRFAYQIVGKKALKIRFTVPHNHLSQLSVFMATNARVNTCQVQWELWEGGKQIRSRVLSADTMEDNAYANWEFEPIEESKGKSYLLKITSPGSSEWNNVAAWMSLPVSAASPLILLRQAWWVLRHEGLKAVFKATVNRHRRLKMEAKAHLLERQATLIKEIPVPQHFREIPVPAKTRILLIAENPQHASSRYRVDHLMEHWKAEGALCTKITLAETYNVVEHPDAFDLVVFQRISANDLVKSLIKSFQRHHVLTVFECDDYIFHPEALQYHADYHKADAITQEVLEKQHKELFQTFSACDAFLCPTETLQKVGQSFRKPSYVIRNGFSQELKEISEQAYNKTKPLFQAGEAVIGYQAGSATHHADFATVSPALMQLMDRYPKLRLVLFGPLEIDKAWAAYANRITRIKFMDWKKLPRKVAETIDINIAPLEDTLFCHGKSELKFFEAALLRTPTVASDTPSFRQAIQHGVNGFLAKTTDDWMNALGQLIREPGLVQKMGEAAYKKAVAFYSPEAQRQPAWQVAEQMLIQYRRRKMPFFSVVAPCYKKTKELPHFLDSFRRQTYGGPFEMIFIDDACPDRSFEVVERYKEAWASEKMEDKKAPIIRILKHDKNKGQCDGRNNGIKAAQGEIIIVIDPDCVVSKDFLSGHAKAHSYEGCDVAIGPFNMETGGRAPLEVVADHESSPEKVDKEMALQDSINQRSFVNCITRNISFKKEFIQEFAELYDRDFRNAADHEAGFGWEDVEVGCKLYEKGVRIKFVPEAFSVHISHEVTTEKGNTPLRSMLNYRRLFEKHPNLLYYSRRWALDTFSKIQDWVRRDMGKEALEQPNKNKDFLENAFQRFLPPPFYIKTERPLKVLTYRWHCAHQYELYKLPHQFTLAKGMPTVFTNTWNYEQRPLRPNARFKHITEINPKDYDVAILHFDENSLSPHNTNGIISLDWGKNFHEWRQSLKIPMVAICHGTPQFYGQYNLNYKDPNLMQVIEEERQKMVNFVGDMLVICNSHQAQREWGFKNSKVIWQGFDPAEFPVSTYQQGILSMGKPMIERPHYRGYFLYQEVFKDFPREHLPQSLLVPEPKERLEDDANEYAYAKFRNYVDNIRRYSIYFNPSLRSPMPRTRGEAMMCGLVSVSANNHDVNLFIKNGVNGFYSNDAHELREYLLYLLHHPDTLQKMGQASRATATDLFNHDRYMQAWEETLRELIA